MTGSSNFHTCAVGPEMDVHVVHNWKEQWVSNGRDPSLLHDDQLKLMLDYIEDARARLQHQAFVAKEQSTGEVIGSVACQLWSGPTPRDAATHEKVGTCWGVFVRPEWRRQGVATQMMQAVLEYWRSIGCARGVLMCASDEARRIYERLGFGGGDMLLLNLDPSSERPESRELPEGDEVITISAADDESDACVAEHWRAMWLEAGCPASQLRPDLESRTTDFIARAREQLEYQAFVAHCSTRHH